MAIILYWKKNTALLLFFWSLIMKLNLGEIVMQLYTFYFVTASEREIKKVPVFYLHEFLGEIQKYSQHEDQKEKNKQTKNQL